MDTRREDAVPMDLEPETIIDEALDAADPEGQEGLGDADSKT
jgi:hypothetical protein